MCYGFLTLLSFFICLTCLLNSPTLLWNCISQTECQHFRVCLRGPRLKQRPNFLAMASLQNFILFLIYLNIFQVPHTLHLHEDTCSLSGCQSLQALSSPLEDLGLIWAAFFDTTLAPNCFMSHIQRFPWHKHCFTLLMGFSLGVEIAICLSVFPTRWEVTHYFTSST